MLNKVNNEGREGGVFTSILLTYLSTSRILLTYLSTSKYETRFLFLSHLLSNIIIQNNAWIMLKNGIMPIPKIIHISIQKVLTFNELSKIWNVFFPLSYLSSRIQNYKINGWFVRSSSSKICISSYKYFLGESVIMTLEIYWLCG